MWQAFLITLREGLEAALIISILLAYLNRLGQEKHSRNIWIGTGLALVVSVGAGGLIIALVGQLSKNAERIFEGVATLLAAALLTWMLVWLKQHAQHIASELRSQIDVALESGTLWAMAGIAFVAVLREGLETVIFLYAFSREASAFDTALGAGLGLGLSAAIGVLLFKGVRVLNFKTFFQVTGVLLIFFASGLLAYGLHELQDAAVIPVFIKEVWNVNHILHDKKGVGLFLKALFGYNGNPSLLEVIAYVSYLVSALVLFLKPTSPKVADSAAA